MSRQKAAPIDPELWELHKADILRLYITKNNTLPVIRDRMRDEFGFTASKSQYETQLLRKWNVRKNFNETEYKYIEHRTKKREAEDRPWEVRFKGALVPATKIRKQLGQRFPPTFLKPVVVDEPASPSDVTVQTPEASELVHLYLQNLPSLQFALSINTMATKVIHSYFSILKTLPESFAISAVLGPIHSDHERIAHHTVLDKSLEVAGRYITTLQAKIGTLPNISTALNPLSEGDVIRTIQWFGCLTANNLIDDNMLFRIYRVLGDQASADLAINFGRLDLSFPAAARFASGLFKQVLCRTVNQIPTGYHSQSTETTEKAHVLKLLILATPNIAYDKTEYLLLAIGYQHLETIQFLLRVGADVNRAGYDFDEDLLDEVKVTPLQKAIYVESFEIVTILLLHGADLNPTYLIRNPLYYLLSKLNDANRLWGVKDYDEKSKSYSKILEALLHAGASVHIGKPFGGRTALQAAAESGNQEIVQYLLDGGYNVNEPSAGLHDVSAIVDGKGCLLQVAARYLNDNRPENLAMFKKVAKAAGDSCRCSAAWGANDGSNQTGITALQGAVACDDLTLVELLLKRGADVNASAGEGPSGMTALQQACACSDLPVVNLLLKHGANIRAPASRGKKCGTALDLTCRAGNVEILEILLSLGAGRPTEGYPGISSASIKAAILPWKIYRTPGWTNVKIVQMLLAYRASNLHRPFSRAVLRDSLVRSIKVGEEKTIQALLETGATIKGVPLASMLTFENNDTALATRLFNMGADLNGCDSDGVTALAWATFFQNKQMITHLLDYNANVNVGPCGFGSMALWTAIDRSGYSNSGCDIIRLLLQKRPIINCHHRTAHAWANVLEYVIWHNGFRKYKFTYTEETHKQCTTVCGIDDGSAYHDPEYAMSDIFDFDAFPDAKGRPERGRSGGNGDFWIGNALPLAVESHTHLSSLNMLLEVGTDPDGIAPTFDQYSRMHLIPTTALANAARNGNDEAIKILLSYGASPNGLPGPFEGWSSLQRACFSGHINTCRLLVEANAEVNLPAYHTWGRTSLQAATEKGSLDLVLFLLNHNADVNAPPARNYGVTALQAAAIKGFFAIALVLLENGADPNGPKAEFEGRTALEGAAEHGRLDMVRILINAGANTGRSSILSAIALAEKEGHVGVVHLLKEYCNSGEGDDSVESVYV